MASEREIRALETTIAAYGTELVDTTAEYVPPKGLAISSIIPTADTVINNVFQLIRYGAQRTRTVAFTAQADYTGTVADAVLFTAADHGLVTGTMVTINSAIAFFAYNGTFEIVVVSHDTFYIVHDNAFMGDYGADVLTCMVSVATEELTAKNWLDTTLPQGTLIFPNWNQPFTGVILTSGACMVYLIKI
jgi:hypothetical protein